MERLKTFSLILIALFSFSTLSFGAPLDQLLNKFEEDIKTGQKQEVVKKDLEAIEKAKENLPVNYVPEVNYLLNKHIEHPPKTNISFVKNLISLTSPIYSSFLAIAFLLMVYTLVFYLQGAVINDTYRNSLTLVSIFLAIISTFTGGFFLLFTAGVCLMLNLKVKKFRFAGLMLLSIVVLFTLQTIQENGVRYVTSYNVLYQKKVDRDGYAPEYLIRKVFDNPIKRRIETITDKLAIGNFEDVKKLNDLATKTENAYLKMVVFNDLGYYYFMMGNFKNAKNYFLKAGNLTDNPIPKINLYLTYSATLQFKKAKSLIKELNGKTLPIPQKPIPVLVHLHPLPFHLKFNWVEILLFLLGIGLTRYITDRLSLKYRYFEKIFRTIPGINIYINNKFSNFIILSCIIVCISYIGWMVCKV